LEGFEVGEKRAISRPKSVKRVRGKDADAKKNKKYCNGFKH
jgi:hypothetical protein